MKYLRKFLKFMGSSPIKHRFEYKVLDKNMTGFAHKLEMSLNEGWRRAIFQYDQNLLIMVREIIND